MANTDSKNNYKQHKKDTGVVCCQLYKLVIQIIREWETGKFFPAHHETQPSQTSILPSLIKHILRAAFRFHFLYCIPWFLFSVLLFL